MVYKDCLTRIKAEREECYGLGMIPPWLEIFLNFVSHEMPRSANSANMFTIEFSHKTIIFTFAAHPFKRGSSFVKAPPLKDLFYSPPCVSELKFSSLAPLL